jgi:hypothetical protein
MKYLNDSKCALRIVKIYDGIRFADQYIVDKTDKMQAVFQGILANKEQYAWEQKQKDGLLKAPWIEVRTINEVNEGIPVIGEVIFTYKTFIPKQRPNIGQRVTRFLLIWFIVSAAIIIPVLIYSMRRGEIMTRCYYYTKHGVPDVVEIDGMEYHLDSEGTVVQPDRSGINPYHYEILANVSKNCEHIDVP